MTTFQFMKATLVLAAYFGFMGTAIISAVS